MPRLDEVHVDARTLMFALIISSIAGLVIGVSPAWRSGNADAGEAMTSRMPTASRGSGRLRFVLVSAQVALSAVCLIAAGLLLHSLVNLLNVDRGFDTKHIMTVGVNLPISRYPTPEKRVEFVRTALDRLKALPGAIDVAAANMLPLAGEGGNAALSMPGTSVPLFERALGNIRTVNGDYFRTMGMSLQAGRLFNDADRERQVAVISMSIAKRAWPGEDPIGKRFQFGPPTTPDREVIGVINDVRGVSLEGGPSFSVYVPYWQGPVYPRHVIRRQDDGGSRGHRACDSSRRFVASMPSCHCRFADDGRSRRRFCGAAPVPNESRARVWSGGHAACQPRRVRCDVVCRDAAHDRDWNPTGTGC